MTRSDQSSCSGLVTEGLDWKLYTLTHHTVHKLGITYPSYDRFKGL